MIIKSALGAQYASRPKKHNLCMLLNMYYRNTCQPLTGPAPNQGRQFLGFYFSILNITTFNYGFNYFTGFANIFLHLLVYTYSNLLLVCTYSNLRVHYVYITITCTLRIH